MPIKKAYQLNFAIYSINENHNEFLTCSGVKISNKINKKESFSVFTPQKCLSWLAAILKADPAVNAVITVSLIMAVTAPKRKRPRRNRVFKNFAWQKYLRFFQNCSAGFIVINTGVDCSYHYLAYENAKNAKNAKFSQTLRRNKNKPPTKDIVMRALT